MTYSTVFENIEARAVIAEIRNGFGLSRGNLSREDFVIPGFRIGAMVGHDRFYAEHKFEQKRRLETSASHS